MNVPALAFAGALALAALAASSFTPGCHGRLLGAEQLGGVVFVDQSPIGKTARSNPVSYVGAWDAIRALFAAAPLAAMLASSVVICSLLMGSAMPS